MPMDSICDIIKKEVEHAEQYGYQYISLEAKTLKAVEPELRCRIAEHVITVRTPNGDVLTYCCPSCNYAIGEKGTTRFCSHCGKALIWGDCNE